MATETHEDFSEPILPGKGASDYERYLRTDDLLALQKTPEERVHPDELLAHISPAHSENINFFGVITVDVEAELAKLDGAGWRPLRPAALDLSRLL